MRGDSADIGRIVATAADGENLCQVRGEICIGLLLRNGAGLRLHPERNSAGFEVVNLKCPGSNKVSDDAANEQERSFRQIAFGHAALPFAGDRAPTVAKGAGESISCPGRPL